MLHMTSMPNFIEQYETLDALNMCMDTCTKFKMANKRMPGFLFLNSNNFCLILVPVCPNQQVTGLPVDWDRNKLMIKF